MSDLSFPDPEVLPAEPPEADQPAKKPHSRLATFLIIGLAAVCLVGLAAMVLVIRQLYQNPAETQGFEQAIDEFMAAASRRDVPAAFAFLSRDGQKQTPRSTLEKMLRGRDFALFDGYQSVHITAFHSYLVTENGAGQAQGEAVEVSGEVAYYSNYVGQIKAVLQKQDGDWRIYTFEIKVPIGKYGGMITG